VSVGSKFWKIVIISGCLVCFGALGTAFAQKDVKYEGGKSGPVTFVHKVHVGGQKLKCNDCHTKLFTKKKEAKITKADHGEKKFCGACHDGSKAFSMTVEADCAKCHKK
jgi:c(7)-type cytochrome triheme protein